MSNLLMAPALQASTCIHRGLQDILIPHGSLHLIQPSPLRINQYCGLHGISSSLTCSQQCFSGSLVSTYTGFCGFHQMHRPFLALSGMCSSKCHHSSTSSPQDLMLLAGTSNSILHAPLCSTLSASEFCFTFNS